MIRRGEIWWAELETPRGSEPSYRRPVVVVQSDAFNASRISTVLVAVLTSNLSLADTPGNIQVSTKDSGLPKDSVVNVSQVLTLDRRFLAERAGALPGKLMEQVDKGLCMVLPLA